jgi:hypothetical protein
LREHQRELDELLEKATKESDSKQLSVYVQQILELLDAMENRWKKPTESTH